MPPKLGSPTTKYRFIGMHTDNLQSGQPLEPGQFVDLTEDEEAALYNKQLIDSKLLLKVDGNV